MTASPDQAGLDECEAYIVLDTMHCDLPPGHDGKHRIEGMTGGDIEWEDAALPRPATSVNNFMHLRFSTVEDFMHYTHDTLDMHGGLMIPGCIYCNGDM